MMLWFAFRTARWAMPRPERQLLVRTDRSRLSEPMQSDFAAGDGLLLAAVIVLAVLALGWLL